MNSHFYNAQNIEAFLENKLSAAEAANFKEAMLKDPLLQNEVDLQKEITEALKSHRKAELKSRLNNIEVSAGPSYLPAKIAASLLLAGLIGWGFYSYVNNEDPKIDTPEAVSEAPIKTQEVVASNNVQENTVIDNSSSIETATPAKVDNKSISKQKTSGDESDISNTSSTPVPHGPNFEDGQFQPNDNSTLPNASLGQLNPSKSDLEVSVDKTTKNKFHYQYSENKLFLYGNFNSKTYEILELNTHQGKQIYLYYDNDYYYLNANQLEPTPLKKISDKKLIQDLDKVNKK